MRVFFAIRFVFDAFAKTRSPDAYRESALLYNKGFPLQIIKIETVVIASRNLCYSKLYMEE